MTDRESIASAFDEARAANGPIDMLIVNAGIAESAPFHKMTRESWDRIISVNLTGAFDTVQAGLPDLLKAEDARVVFVASVASLRGVPYAAHYAASKHGLLGLMRSMAAEYAKSKMTVNAICPGYVDTPMTDQSVARVSQITGRGEVRCALGDHQHECKRPAGRSASDRQPDPHALLAAEPRYQWCSRDHRRRHERVSFDAASFQPTHFLWNFADGVATITLNRPERKNPLTFESYAELRDTFQD